MPVARLLPNQNRLRVISSCQRSLRVMGATCPLSSTKAPVRVARSAQTLSAALSILRAPLLGFPNSLSGGY